MKPNQTNTENVGQQDQHRGWLSRLGRLFQLRDLRNAEEDIAALEARVAEYNRYEVENMWSLQRIADCKAELARKRKRAEWLREMLMPNVKDQRRPEEDAK